MSRSKPRRAIPLIRPEHLRDHADEARVERIWARLERNLPLAPHGRAVAAMRAPRWAALCAAAAIGGLVTFGVEQLAGHRSRHDDGRAPLLAASDSAPTVVFAAGTNRRDYALPGGGRISVMPGTIVDTVSSDARGLTLRLVRGEASVSTTGAGGAGRATPLAMLVGNAEITTALGDLHLRHRGDLADFEVLGGSAEVTSPDAELGLRKTMLRSNQVLTVPLRLRTAEVVPPSTPVRLHNGPTRDDEPQVSVSPVLPLPPAAPGWRDYCAAGDFSAALDLLRQEPGGGQTAITAAQGAGDLDCISYAYRARGGDRTVAVQALERMVADFPSSAYATNALFQLARLYEQAGKLDKARSYYERYRSLSPDGVLAEDALCQAILAAGKAGEREAVTRLAQEYRTQYPDGPCEVEDIERLVAETAAPDAGATDGGAGRPGASPDAGPYDDGPAAPNAPLGRPGAAAPTPSAAPGGGTGNPGSAPAP